MPQPFIPREGQQIHDLPRIIETRPKCALKIATIAAEWTRVERVMAEMFATVTGRVSMTSADTAMHSNNVAALYALRAIQSLSTRIAVVKSATEVRLSTEQRAEFEKLTKALRDRAGERNDVVHGQWCTVDAYPDDLLLRVDGPQRVAYTRYTEKDFERIIERIILLTKALNSFGWNHMWVLMAEQLKLPAESLGPKPLPPSE